MNRSIGSRILRRFNRFLDRHEVSVVRGKLKTSGFAFEVSPLVARYFRRRYGMFIYQNAMNVYEVRVFKRCLECGR